MTITTELRVLTAESEIPELARVKAAAFKDSPFHIAMYPVKDEKAMLAFYDARERQAFLNPRRTIVAVVDSNSKELTILAWARWLIPLAIINKQRAVSGESPLLYTVDSVSKTRAEAPEGTNVAFRTAFLDWCSSLNQTHEINDEEDYELINLATHPDARGKGYASMLLKWGIDHAERNKARIILTSTPMAYGLYLKHGWHDIDEVDFAGYGAPTIKAMIREPQDG